MRRPAVLGAFARISTVLLALVITVLGWFAHGPAIASAPASAPHLIYTYAASHGSVPIVGCPSERSPPGTGQFDTTHAGVDFMSDGACARSESTSTPDHPTTYDSSAAPVQITRATDTTQTVARGNAATFLALASSMVAAKSADEVAEGVSRSPSFIVKPNGETVIVPKGAQGPFPVESGKGFMFRGGSGGHGLSDAASDVRIMDPVTGGGTPSPTGTPPTSMAAGRR